MSAIKLYPPGGGVPVTPHPAMIETMKANGWTEKEKPKQKPVKEDK